MPPEPPNIPNNAEIDKALKEFEANRNRERERSAQTTPVPESPIVLDNEIEGVKFETENYTGAIKYYKENIEPKMVKAVMKLSGGMITEQRQAEWVLLGFVVIALGISIFLFSGGVGGSKAKPLTKSQIDHIIKIQQGILNP